MGKQAKKKFQSLNLHLDDEYNRRSIGHSYLLNAITPRLPNTGPTDSPPSSEFPSLGPQPHQPSSVPQAWNSTALRQAQQPPPAQRPQPVPQTQQRSVSGQTTSSQQHHDIPNIEAQYDGQSGGSVRGSGEQQSQDEFPPLGGQMNGDPRRAQGAINGLIGQMNGQVDRAMDAQSGDGTFGAGAGSADGVYS